MLHRHWRKRPRFPQAVDKSAAKEDSQRAQCVPEAAQRRGSSMRQLTSIVARNESGVIGAKNRLPWRVKNDMRFFRTTTVDNVVILGRRTYASLDGCLPKRHNVVVTHGFALFPEGPACQSAGDIDEALVLAANAAGRRRSVFVIGGATMYEQFAALVDRYLITDIKMPVLDADTYFDPTWLGDDDRWTRRVLERGYADGVGNEADFEIVEYIAKDAAEIASRRNAILEKWRVRSQRSLSAARPSL